MKYAATLFIVFMVWMAMLIIAGFMKSSSQILELYLLFVGFTMGLFVIGFRGK
jgi:hypothetical protein